ncbi:DUF4349 domain-containing protein, partial [Streptomyces sp. CC77]|uniref:DUF4349 domain-containing protein n=1 Tax=Streptomyces sp. CC77 TaxID=1906739 RepID=UPI0009A13495
MPTRSRHALAAVLLGASLALAGCGSGADGATSAADRGAAAPPAEGNAAEAPGYAGSAAAPGDRAPGQAAGEGAAQPGGRVPAGRQHVIRTAEMHIEVEDVEKALARARTVAVDAGGHVADESTERHARGDGRGGISSRVTLRVPQRAYDAVMKELSGAGKLLSRTAGAKDVTDQVVDVESRIATQRASVERVRKLMDEATQLSDVVTLEGELSRRQAELESLLARQAALKDSTSLATITLELSERGAARHEDGDDKPGFLDALRGGWGALVASAAWVLIVLAALAPWLAVAAVAYALWRLLARPWRARRHGADVRAAVPSGASGLPVHPAPAGAAAHPRPAQGPHGPQAQHVPATDRQTQAAPTPQSPQTP